VADSATSEERFDALADEFVERQRQRQKLPVEGDAATQPDLATGARRVTPTAPETGEFKPGSADVTGRYEVASVVVRGARLERLGDFRVLREAGRGGMGVVYEAEQESLGRRVALKVLASHAVPDPAQVKRFEREARAAAQLHHTNIVPVFGVGEQDGLHYYAMQFIQGMGLDNVIEEVKRLRSANRTSNPAVTSPPESRENPGAIAPTAAGIARSLVTEQFGSTQSIADEPLPIKASRPDELGIMIHSPRPLAGSANLSSEVVLGHSGLSSDSGSDARYWRSVARVGEQVAGALEYAHTQGIFHRDIKPSNLLLDAQGTVWVADFGLAKAIEGDDLTHTGDIVGTLRYMAPERFHGRCDARSDVYALGLTLYEMVALRPAFEQAGRQALVRQVMEEEPPRLRKISPDVPRDLETVIQKAIAREPASRYATAGALAADLALFLDGKPVRARDTGVVERSWKWAKRRPTIAALIFGLAVTAVSGMAAVIWQWRAAVAARDEARQALKMASEAVNTSYKEVSEDFLLNEPGMQPLRERLLKLSLPYYKAFAEQNTNDPALQVQLANAFFRWGTITGEIGSKEESKRILSTAIGHFKALRIADPTNLEICIGLARSCQAFALEAVRSNQPEEGYQTAGLAAELWAEVVRARPDDAEALRCLGRSHDIAGWGRAEAGDTVSARREFEKAVEVLSDAAKRSPTDFETRRLLTRALNNFAANSRNEDDLAAAERTNQKARELLAPLLEDRPNSTNLRKEMAATLRLLGQVHLLLGACNAAEAELAQARRLIEGVVRDNPNVIEYRYIQGEIYSYLGRALAEQGQTTRARAFLQQQIVLGRALVRLNPTSSEFSMCLAETNSYLAGVERETDHVDLAESACQEALAITNKERREPVPNMNLRVIHFRAVVESVRLAARTGDSLSSRAATLRTLLQELDNTPASAMTRGDRRLAVEGYLALAEVAARGGLTPEVLEALQRAESTLDVLLRATPEQPRLRNLKATIDLMRGSALAGSSEAAEAKAAAKRAVVIEEKLAAEDHSYCYDLACALALQARLDPAAPVAPSAAVAALRKAVETGFDNVSKLKNDERLASIRHREEFRTLVQDAERNAAALDQSGDDWKR
jgi:eukaryotic-like serine/threonine-protein kinase